MPDHEITRRRFVGRSLAVPLLAGVAAASPTGGASRGPYTIERIDLYTRLTPPPRMEFAIGKQDGKPKKPLSNPIGHVRMMIRDSRGNRTFGCSGERLSVRWLDKRHGFSRHEKLCDLVALIERARQIYLERPEFGTPFDKWLSCYKRIQQAGRQAAQVDLTSGFASSLLERAMLDGVARLAGEPLFRMVRHDRLGVRPEAVHPELAGMETTDYVGSQPVTHFHIRHCIGLTDPLVDADLPAARRVNDGLPETLEEYVATDGLTHFKIKLQGEPGKDLARLERIWAVLPKGPDLLITMDANEMFPDVRVFGEFIEAVRRRLPKMLDAVAWFEQPMSRASSLDPAAAQGVRRLSRVKPLIIDEADGTLTAFKQAHAIGYAGTSHKNCKGFFKSLLNRALVAYYQARGEKAFLSGEDLTCLPIVPLHEDCVSQSILGIEHGDRNGHHYHFGLSSLSPREKAQIARHHTSMYVHRHGEWFLNIRYGQIDCTSLQCPGYGVAEEPDWESMDSMRHWLETRDRS